jgi:addiction module RelB/DinJ family antitoxin
VKKILEKIGLNMSSTIKLFLRQTKVRKGLPFLLLKKNGLTLEEKDSTIKASVEAKKGKNVSLAMSPKKATAYLKSL